MGGGIKKEDKNRGVLGKSLRCVDDDKQGTFAEGGSLVSSSSCSSLAS